MANKTSPLSTILTTVFVAVMTVSLVTAFVMASDIFLILFLAILFGVFLYHASNSLASRVGLTYSQSVGAVTTALVVTFVAGLVGFGFQVDQQIDNSQKHLDRALAQLENFGQTYPTLGSMMTSTPILKDLVDVKSVSQQETQKQSSQQKTEKKSDSPNEGSNAEQTALRNAAKQIATAFAKLFQTTFGLLVNSLLILVCL